MSWRYVMLFLVGLQLMLQPWQSLAAPTPAAASMQHQGKMTSSPHLSSSHQASSDQVLATHDCCVDADRDSVIADSHAHSSQSSPCQGDCGDCPQHCSVHSSLVHQVLLVANDLRETELLPFQALSITPALALPKRPPRS
ncbi:hypothetical protein [Idiomarina xiamenensis]|uniref:DUF2946 domain-containing protein n=1 Tax=Idiomarina xiamenensis 10-D-4 TaxID=740709 RepID=K2JP86_9GAMM|nr:hypothetical protein [Idiomarina xiamenensis]EKE85306.1 hypothetical protein A10D4_03140 [Idiomarina xiamenensis 10-D-4]